jgi:hypothetical protein
MIYFEFCFRYLFYRRVNKIYYTKLDSITPSNVKRYNVFFRCIESVNIYKYHQYFHNFYLMVVTTRITPK